MADEETWINDGAIKRQLHYYVDEMIREAIKMEMQSLDFSVHVKKLIHEEVRKYLEREKVMEKFNNAGLTWAKETEDATRTV